MDFQQGYKEGCSYVIVYDTFGDGLRSFDPGEVDIYHTEGELKDGIIGSYYSAGDLLDLDLDESSHKKVNKLAIDSLVICEVMDMRDYATSVVKDYAERDRNVQYQTYLKLKEIFENDPVI